jgi:phosphatidylglycerophosphatase C
MLKTFALFDFDGTLLPGDSIILFMRYAWRKKLCSAWDLLRFAVAGVLFSSRLVTPKRAKEIGLRFLSGKERAEYSAAAEDFCRSVIMPRLYPQGVEAVRRHREAGHTVLLVSASPTFYLEPLKALLGFTEVIGTRFATDETGRFADKIVGQNCRGEQKVKRVQDYLTETGTEIDDKTSCAYGDSPHDLPMLSLCEHIFIVNPNKMMREMLGSHDGVTILDWKERP